MQTFYTLRTYLINKKPAIFKTSHALCSFCIVLLLLIISPNPALGIELTKVKHVYDISHDFSQPSDVSVSENGNVYVLDGVNNKVKVFDPKCIFKFSFGSKGDSDGKFSNPLGIDIDSSGRVYIADSGNHRVQIFESTGKYLSQLNDDNISDPTDVVVDESIDRLFVVDNENHYILSYELSTLKFIKTFGAPGAEEREFRYPFLATLDKDKYLYITDVVNTRVQVFNSKGQFVNIIGGWGVEKGKFFRPKGIAVDRNNLIYVSDGYMGVIQVFKTNGDFHSVIGNPDDKTVMKFIKPMGMFIDRNNRLYVVEMFANRVRVYDIEK